MMCTSFVHCMLLFLEYDIKFLMKNLYRFQILIHIKSLKQTFLLAFENEQNEYVNSINIILNPNFFTKNAF